jgi:hypothetical protein
VFVVAPHNNYPVAPGAMTQVPLYPNNQPQVYLIPGNPPHLRSTVSELPAQKVLKEGKVLGVSDTSLCRPGATWLQWEEAEGLGIYRNCKA